MFDSLVDYILEEASIYKAIRPSLCDRKKWPVHKLLKNTDGFQSPVWLRVLQLVTLIVQSIVNLVLYPVGLELNDYYVGMLEYGMRRRVYLEKLRKTK